MPEALRRRRRRMGRSYPFHPTRRYGERREFPAENGFIVVI